MNTNEKLRDGLETIIKRIDEAIKTDNAQFLTGALLHIRETAKGMLALPLRNCDVGTDMEQSKRFDKFCKKRGDKCALGGKGSCPIFKGYKVDCGITWAQLPYEKEGEE